MTVALTYLDRMLADGSDKGEWMRARATGITATSEGTDGNVLVDEGFNVLNGWLYVPVVEDRIVVRPGESIGLKFPAAPTNLTWNCGISWLEY